MFKLKNKKIIGISVVILIFFVLLELLFLHSQKKLPLPNLPFHKGEEQEGSLPNKTIPETSDLSFKDNTPGEMSVYDLMSKMRSEGKINFTEKNYIGMGEFIDSINGIKNNSNQSWIYYVNGIEMQVGVSNYKIKSGDVISWKYEKSNY
jgi:hypothetical protein